jgi:N-acetylmuramoyl-L-alanine amidase
MNIIQKNSPNFTNGRENKGIQEFIIHWMAGTLASTDATFQNRARNTSAHYGIEDDKIHQYVSLDNTAYHAGNWGVNQTSIGIEHSAQPGRNASDATYESSAQLIAPIIKAGRVGRSYRKHSAIVATACPGTIDLDRIARRVNEILGTNAPIITPAPTPAPAATSAGVATVTVPPSS